MSRFAIIEDGAVVNVATGDPDLAADRGWIACDPGVGPGWTHDGEAFAAPDPLPGAQAGLLEAVRARREACFAAGFSHDFGGAIGTHRLDLRDASDKANWLGLLTRVQGMIGAGGGADTVTIRTADDVTIEPSAAAVQAALLAMLVWVEAVLARSWALKDAVVAADDVEALAAVAPDEGWPE